MHASPNASFCGGTRQAPQHAVLSTRRACNCPQCPCGSLGARCHLLGPELRHAAAASLMWLSHFHAPACFSAYKLCVRLLRGDTRHRLPLEIHSKQRLPCSRSVSAPASRFSLTAATGPLRHTTRVDTIPRQGTGQPLFVLIPRSRRLCYLCSKNSRRHFIIHNVRNHPAFHQAQRCHGANHHGDPNTLHPDRTARCTGCGATGARASRHDVVQVLYHVGTARGVHLDRQARALCAW
jgi:hypothetical protein